MKFNFKEKMLIELQKESLALNQLIFDQRMNLKEQLKTKLLTFGIEEDPETKEFFSKLQNLFFFENNVVSF